MDNRKKVRYLVIKDLLKDMLRSKKYNDEQQAILELHELRGALRYMYISGEITWETRNRINHLATLILRKIQH